MKILDFINDKNYIAGRWLNFPKKIEIINPSTNKLIGTVPDLDSNAIKNAIDNTYENFIHWSLTSIEERRKILKAWYDLIHSNIETLAEIITLEQGKIIEEAKGEVTYGASFIDWFLSYIHHLQGSIKNGINKRNKIIAEYEPVGPVAAITPWNFPLAMITRKLAPALAAGCSVLLKPSSLTPFSALALIKLAEEAGLPGGVVNVITGDSELIGKIICEDFRIRKLSFTGSTEVGKILYQNSAPTLKRLSLELGGNAPFIILDDIDLERTANDLIVAKIRSSGQSCTSPNRILIQDKIYEKFINIITDKFSKLIAGDGFETKSNIGPLINLKAVHRISELIDEATNKGARIMCGGQVQGNFFNPTILADCEDDMEIFKNEIFGPVLACYKFSNLDEVIKRANNTEYGLQAYIYTKNINNADYLASKLECGMVSINSPLPSNAKAPFGGRKASGFGVEGGSQGIYEFLNIKYINLNFITS